MNTPITTGSSTCPFSVPVYVPQNLDFKATCVPTDNTFWFQLNWWLQTINSFMHAILAFEKQPIIWYEFQTSISRYDSGLCHNNLWSTCYSLSRSNKFLILLLEQYIMGQALVANSSGLRYHIMDENTRLELCRNFKTGIIVKVDCHVGLFVCLCFCAVLEIAAPIHWDKISMGQEMAWVGSYSCITEQVCYTFIMCVVYTCIWRARCKNGLHVHVSDNFWGLFKILGKFGFFHSYTEF